MQVMPIINPSGVHMQLLKAEFCGPSQQMWPSTMALTLTELFDMHTPPLKPSDKRMYGLTVRLVVFM